MHSTMGTDQTLDKKERTQVGSTACETATGNGKFRASEIPATLKQQWCIVLRPGSHLYCKCSDIASTSRMMLINEWLPGAAQWWSG